MARLPYPDYTYHSHPMVNVLKLLAHSPSTVDHWIAIAFAHFQSLQLTAKLREIVTLYLSARFQSSYEWDHHVAPSTAAGITDAQRELLQATASADADEEFFAHGGGKGVFEERELAMLAFLEAMVRGPTVSDELWEETRRHFTGREVVELVSLQGFYYMVLRLGTVLKVDMDEPAVAKEKL